MMGTPLVVADAPLVAQGMRQAARTARRQARTFYVAFCLLPKKRRWAMYALYAFSRAVDDVADAPGLTPEQRRQRLDAWHRDLDAALSGHPRTPLVAALATVTHEYRIPPAMLHTLVEGVTMDLVPGRHRTLEELRRYCHAVAGVVGQMSMRIFGGDAGADPAADELGFALQLTNILRDIAEDAALGRFYLPLDELEAAGLDEAAILAHRGEPYTPAHRFLALQGERAARAFAALEELRPLASPGSRPCLEAIAQLYADLLAELRRRNFAVAAPRVRLPLHRKLLVAGQAATRSVVAGLDGHPGGRSRAE